MTHLELITIIVSFLLGAFGVPQAWKAFLTKRATDISWIFLVMWGLGDFALLYYSIVVPLHWALIANYAVNAITVSVIAWYK